MITKLIEDVIVPTHLVGKNSFESEDELLQWENELISFFTSQYNLFTPYQEFFKIRCYEFRILRQLLPELLSFKSRFRRGLEIGCGYGFKSLLLSHMCETLLGIDIPIKYKGYVRGNFNQKNSSMLCIGVNKIPFDTSQLCCGVVHSSVEIAEIIVKDKFQIENVAFETAWPDNLLNIDSNSFSFVFSEYVLEHIPKLPKAISEMYRVMQKDAIMIHVVPNAKDALIQFAKAQINMSGRRLLKELLKKLFRRGSSRVKLNGIIIPSCHSEFINDYSKQIDIYSLENYLFPMIDAGFKIERIVSTREHNDVIVARK